MAASYLLDTNIIVAGIRGESRGLLSRTAGLASSRLVLSSLVQAQLLYGADKAQRGAQARAALTVFVDGMTVVSFDSADAQAYGQVRVALERKGLRTYRWIC